MSEIYCKKECYVIIKCHYMEGLKVEKLMKNLSQIKLGFF